MTASAVSKRLLRLVAGAIGAALLLIVLGITSLPLVGKAALLDSYKRHQISHVLHAAGVQKVSDLIGRNAYAISWSVIVADDDPRVCELTLNWRTADSAHSARWAVLHEVSWTAQISFIEVAALDDTAHALTPQLQRRDSLIGNSVPPRAPDSFLFRDRRKLWS